MPPVIYFAAIRALRLGCCWALVCDLVTLGMAATTFDIALALAWGLPAPVRAAIVAGEALRTVGARGGGGGGTGGALLGTPPASFSPDTALMMSTRDAYRFGFPSRSCSIAFLLRRSVMEGVLSSEAASRNGKLLT